MKKILLSAACVLALGLSACESGLSSVVTNPPTTAGTLVDEKALLGAETSYHVLGTTLELAVDTGRLKGANAAKARDLNQKAYRALLAARAAQKAANATDYATKVAEVLSLVKQVEQIIKQSPG